MLERGVAPKRPHLRVWARLLWAAPCGRCVPQLAHPPRPAAAARPARFRPWTVGCMAAEPLWEAQPAGDGRQQQLLQLGLQRAGRAARERLARARPLPRLTLCAPACAARAHVHVRVQCAACCRWLAGSCLALALGCVFACAPAVRGRGRCAGGSSSAVGSRFLPGPLSPGCVCGARARMLLCPDPHPSAEEPHAYAPVNVMRRREQHEWRMTHPVAPRSAPPPPRPAAPPPCRPTRWPA